MRGLLKRAGIPVLSIHEGVRPLLRTTTPPGPRNRNHDRHTQTTARALVLEPRVAVLRALRTWAAEHPISATDLAAMDRVFALLAAADHGPNLDLVMRDARRRVIGRARERRLASG